MTRTTILLLAALATSTACSSESADGGGGAGTGDGTGSSGRVNDEEHCDGLCGDAVELCGADAVDGDECRSNCAAADETFVFAARGTSDDPCAELYLGPESGAPCDLAPPGAPCDDGGSGSGAGGPGSGGGGPGGDGDYGDPCSCGDPTFVCLGTENGCRFDLGDGEDLECFVNSGETGSGVCSRPCDPAASDCPSGFSCVEVWAWYDPDHANASAFYCL